MDQVHRKTRGKAINMRHVTHEQVQIPQNLGMSFAML